MNEQAVQWLIGLTVGVLLAVGGGFIKYLFGTIKSHKEDTERKIDRLEQTLEQKRRDDRDNLLQLINTKLDAIWESVRDLKDKVT